MMIAWVEVHFILVAIYIPAISADLTIPLPLFHLHSCELYGGSQPKFRLIVIWLKANDCTSSEVDAQINEGVNIYKFCIYVHVPYPCMCFASISIDSLFRLSTSLNTVTY